MVILERLGGRSSRVKQKGARLVAFEAFQESNCTRQTRILSEQKHMDYLRCFFPTLDLTFIDV